ncbi:SIR2 family protein [Pseudenhygromyxa sp. WMMC2535]|uniref:nSTAND1 domain-containing NTPase n=1 Tax=Pseudenhygromyxa sp. WMMC2535 TaxID=2712867 RepID=UPI00155319D3|nr:SIR2 family protein [Pseudenhygromyxa sp. WMMC2535]NVB43009.1 SIR2 family protein [Pseudenhygromyxa sp. WMMC2535]
MDRIASTTQRPALIEALERRELIICVGPELGLAAGLPGLGALVEALLADVEAQPDDGDIDVDTASLREWVADGRTDQALEILERRMGARFRRVIERELGERGHPPPAFARVLARLGGHLRAVYTTGLHRLLERAFSDAWPSFSTAQGDLARRHQVIVKLCGTLEFPETWALTRAAIEREFGEGAPRRQLVAAALRAHCVLFVGFCADDPLLERFFNLAAAIADSGPLPEHFVILPSCSLERRALLEARGLQVITGQSTEVLAEIAELVGIASAARQRSLEIELLPPCPYPGLQAFDQSLAQVFHGRRAEVSAAASLLGGPPERHRRWLAVDGSSGVGKSSFVHAGVVPALRRGFAEHTPARWIVATMRPGQQPLRALVEALAAALGTRGPMLDASTVDIVAELGAMLDAPHPRGAAVLVIVDQLEELVTLAEPREREGFVQVTSRLIERGRIYLITTLRTDFGAALATAAPAFGRLLNELAARYTLAPISRVGLRAAIAEPAQQFQVSFEADLVERIASDAEQHLGRNHQDEDGIVRTDDAALPLVAHVLRGLWDAHAADDGLITFAEYEALGRVSGALSRSADALLAELGDNARARARALLLRMVNLDGGRLTRRTLPRDEAIDLAGGPQQGEALLGQLSGAGGPRILVIRHDEQDRALVDIVHEALLREWDTLRGWIAADRAQLARDEALARRAVAWVDQGRPWRSLPRGPERRELLRGRVHGETRAVQREYQHAMRRAGWLRAGSSVAVVGLAVGLAAWGASLYNDIDQKINDATSKLAKKTTESEDQADKLEETNNKLEKTTSNFETKDQIRDLLDDARCHQALGGLTSGSYYPYLDEAISCQVIIGEAREHSIAAGHSIVDMTIAPDTQQAWFVTDEPGLWHLDTHDAEPIRIESFDVSAQSITYSPKGERLAVLASGQTRLLNDHGIPVHEAAHLRGGAPTFSPTGSFLATHHNGSVFIYDTTNGAPLASWPVDDGKIIDKVFVSETEIIVGTASKNTGKITRLHFDPTKGSLAPEKASPWALDGYLRDLQLVSVDYLASMDDHGLGLWSLSNEQAPPAFVDISLLELSERRVWASERGDSILANDKAALRLFDINLVEQCTISNPGHSPPPLFSPDERWLVVNDATNQLTLYATDTCLPQARLSTLDTTAPTAPTAPTAMAFADPQRLLIARGNTLEDRRLDTHTRWRGSTDRLTSIESLYFVDQNKMVSTHAGSNMTQRWSIGEAPELFATALDLEAAIAIAGTAENRHLALTSEGLLVQWFLDGQAPKTLRETCPAKLATFSPDGRVLAQLCEDGRVLLSLAESSEDAEIEIDVGIQPTALALGGPPESTRLALGANTGEVRVWQIESQGAQLSNAGTLDIEAGVHRAKVSAMAIDDSGQRLVSGDLDGRVLVWNLDSPHEHPKQLQDSNENINAVAISREGQALRVAAGESHHVQIWRDILAPTTSEASEVCLASHKVNALRFSPTGDRLAAGCSGTGGISVIPIGTAALLEFAEARLAATSID